LELRKFHEHLFWEIGLVFSKINREELLKKIRRILGFIYFFDGVILSGLLPNLSRRYIVEYSDDR